MDWNKLHINKKEELGIKKKRWKSVKQTGDSCEFRTGRIEKKGKKQKAVTNDVSITVHPLQHENEPFSAITSV